MVKYISSERDNPEMNGIFVMYPQNAAVPIPLLVISTQPRGHFLKKKSPCPEALSLVM